jgi:hypothetical protein
VCIRLSYAKTDWTHVCVSVIFVRNKASAGGFRVCMAFFISEASQSNKCFENVMKFKYLGMIITNKNHVYEEIKIRSRAAFKLIMFYLSICYQKT